MKVKELLNEYGITPKLPSYSAFKNKKVSEYWITDWSHSYPEYDEATAKFLNIVVEREEYIFFDFNGRGSRDAPFKRAYDWILDPRSVVKDHHYSKEFKKQLIVYRLTGGDRI